MWKPSITPDQVLQHSAKGSEWKEHMYVEEVDGKYYYPDGYEGGRHLSSLKGGSSSDSKKEDTKSDKATKSTYSKDDHDFDESSYSDKNLLGDTNFYGFKNKEGKTVILEEDMKWTLPEGKKLDSALIKRLEAVDKEIEARRDRGEKIDSDEWNRLVDEAINGGNSKSKKNGSSSSKNKKSSSKGKSGKSQRQIDKERRAKNQATIKKRTEEQQKTKRERMRKNLMEGKSYLNHSSASIWAPTSSMYELYHSGTKGMRWGRRQYQNQDGSLTPLGRIHYGVGKSRKPGKYSYNKKSSRVTRDQVQNTKTLLNAASHISKDTSYLTKQMAKRERAKQKAAYHPDLSNMSDRELRKTINRMNMEREYKDLTMRYRASGYETATDILALAGSVASLGVSAATIYLAIKK